MFTWKKTHKIAGSTVEVIGLNAIFSLVNERSKCFSSHNMFAYFAPSISTWSTTTFLLFRCYLLPHKKVFLNPIMAALSKTFLCFLSGVQSKCISDSAFLSFKNTRYVILKTNLLFPIHFCLKLPASKWICALITLSLQPSSFNHTYNSLHCLSKKSVFRTNSVKAEGLICIWIYPTLPPIFDPAGYCFVLN